MGAVGVTTVVAPRAGEAFSFTFVFVTGITGIVGRNRFVLVLGSDAPTNEDRLDLSERLLHSAVAPLGFVLDLALF